MIINHQVNQLSQKIYHLTQELKELNKGGGEKIKIEQKQQELQQLKKKHDNLMKEREKDYPTCPFCQKKVQPECLVVDGVPRNYHIECYYQVEELIIKKKHDNLNHKDHDDNSLLLNKLEKIEKDVESIKKILMKK